MDINEDTSVNISNIQKKNINKDGHDIKKRMERKKRTFVPLIKLLQRYTYAYTYKRRYPYIHMYICTYVYTYVHMYLRNYIRSYVST